MSHDEIAINVQGLKLGLKGLLIHLAPASDKYTIRKIKNLT